MPDAPARPDDRWAASRGCGWRAALAGSPWPGRARRGLALAAGVLLMAGPLQPWVYIPVGGLRVPYYGLFSPGGLALIAGLVLLARPAPGPILLLAIAGGAGYVALSVPPRLIAGAHGTLGIVDSWLDPLNQLLDRFHVAGMHLTDLTLPAARPIGPGVRTTLWGAGLAAAAAIAALLSTPVPTRRPRACSRCAASLARRRDLRFCPQCGDPLTPSPVCPRCAATAEPGDRFCGQCGAGLREG